jgi:uncharacterized membrane protein
MNDPRAKRSRHRLKRKIEASQVQANQSARSDQPYKAALADTQRLIDDRAKSLRRLMLAVTIITAGSIVMSLIIGIRFGLALLSWALPIAGYFFAADLKRTFQWRAAIMEDWVHYRLHINAAVAAVRALTNLPQATVEAMLALLPPSGDLSVELNQSRQTRSLIATVIEKYSRDQVQRQKLKAMLALAVVAFTSAALVSGDFRWLMGVVLVVIGFSVRWRGRPSIPADVIVTLRSIAEDPACDRSAARDVLHEMVEHGQLSPHWLTAPGVEPTTFGSLT